MRNRDLLFPWIPFHIRIKLLTLFALCFFGITFAYLLYPKQRGEMDYVLTLDGIYMHDHDGNFYKLACADLDIPCEVSDSDGESTELWPVDWVPHPILPPGPNGPGEPELV